MLFSRLNSVKTANRNSRIDFYFVTAFYRLDDICMVEYRKTWFFRQEDMKTCFLRRVCLAYLILEWNLSQSYKKSEITTTFKQETCRNLAFLLRLRQVWFRKTVPNVLVKQRADYKLPKYRYCIKRETMITLPTEKQRVIMFNKQVVTE